MTNAVICFLPDRGVVRVSGDDAAHLVDSLITNAIARLDQGGAIHAGLLSPKGKVLFDFFVVRDGADLLIETARDEIDALIKRLTLYRLRAKVTFEDVSDAYLVVASWGGSADTPDGAIAFQDPRQAALGYRILWPAAQRDNLLKQVHDASTYKAHRIAVGIPEAGEDFELGEAFPHEAMYDLLGSVDFSKGCFVGQEVVSRMHHLGTPRSRIVPVHGDKALCEGCRIMAGETQIGTVGSVDGRDGLALVRLDRAHAAEEAGTALLAGDVHIRLARPDWADLDMTTGAAVKAN
jgi:tRNA-modifying protein YgfZ